MLTAQAYITARDANNYFATSVKSGPWDRSSFEEQEKALFEASRLIDTLPLYGTKFIAGQILRFPRHDQTVVDSDPDSETYGQDIGLVPDDVKEACCLIACAILDGVDADEEYAQLSITSKRYATLNQGKNTSMVEAHVEAGIPSKRAFDLLVKYLRVDRSVQLRRNS